MAAPGNGHRGKRFGYQTGPEQSRYGKGERFGAFSPAEGKALPSLWTSGTKRFLWPGRLERKFRLRCRGKRFGPRRQLATYKSASAGAGKPQKNCSLGVAHKEALRLIGPVAQSASVIWIRTRRARQIICRGRSASPPKSSSPAFSGIGASANGFSQRDGL